MEASYIFIKNSGLADENKFLVELTSRNEFEKVKLSKNNKYFILNLKIDAKLENEIELFQ